jgi:hypothetical protein
MQYSIELGMPADRIFTGYNCVDNNYFSNQAEIIRNQQCRIRTDYNLEKPYILSIVMFKPEKEPHIYPTSD